jgi:hypothetical protein
MAGERSIMRVRTDRMILLLGGVIALELLGHSRTPSWREHGIRQSWQPLVVLATTILVMAMAAAGSVQARDNTTVKERVRVSTPRF